MLKIVPKSGDVDQTLLASRLRECLFRHEPVSLIAGPAIVGASSVVLDLTPDTDWRRVQAAVATVVDDVLGIGAARINSAERPHITLAYGIGEADSGVLQSRLRRATDQRCHLTPDPSGLGGRHSGQDHAHIPMDARFQPATRRTR